MKFDRPIQFKIRDERLSRVRDMQFTECDYARRIVEVAEERRKARNGIYDYVVGRIERGDCTMVTDDYYKIPIRCIVRTSGIYEAVDCCISAWNIRGMLEMSVCRNDTIVEMYCYEQNYMFLYEQLMKQDRLDAMCAELNELIREGEVY